ncbi:MAG: hypothetical protein L7H10_04160 [Vulcanisaeta sp.]|jgi:hypothetical protein|nr:hypothetical protein [Vulcanisaeta sp.]MCG2887176.1 hypothetical protein [Vulcanisaeta sp.]
MSNESALANVLDLMKRLEIELAMLYSNLAGITHDPAINLVMRKISIESAAHSYILTMIGHLVRECPPRRVMETEYLVSMQGKIEESLRHIDEIRGLVNSRGKVDEEATISFIVNELSELEGFESSATQVYSFLLRSYLPITSTRANPRCRTVSKLIVRLLKGISDDEKSHGELLRVLGELLGRERIKKG